MSSMLYPNCVIAKDVNSCTYCWYIRCMTLQIWVGGTNRRISVPYTVRTSRQRICNERVGCLQWLWSRSLDLLNGLALGCYHPSPEVLIVRIVDFYKFSFSIISVSLTDSLTDLITHSLTTAHSLCKDDIAELLWLNWPFLYVNIQEMIAWPPWF